MSGLVFDGDQSIPCQQSIMQKVYLSTFDHMREGTDPFSRARLISFSAPGSGRWQQAVPSVTLDKHLSNGEINTSVSLQLGVDVIEEQGLCGFCGAVLDSKGIHCGSCTAGGDVNLRHNNVRDSLHSFCKRGRLRPELEKAGLLQDDAVFIDLRRPADVLVEGVISTTRQTRQQRTALDVKVINSLGVDHFDLTLQGPHEATSAYREAQMARDNTFERCQANGIQYEPMVFTAQGGCHPKAEAIINQIAKAVADTEEVPVGQIKTEIMESISLSIARSLAAAVARRRPRRRHGPPGLILRTMAQTQTLEDILE